MRAGATVGLVVVVLIAAAHRSAADAPEKSSTHEAAFTSASCDENNNAVDVEPDTAQAWADAAAWCTSSGEWLDKAPWPGSLHPVLLPAQLDGGR